MKKNAKILWIDLEMTGLDPAKDRILEVAAIATDWNFSEIATFESPIKVDEKLIEKRMVGKFWEEFNESRAGLIEQNSKAISGAEEIEYELINFVKENFAEEIEKGEKILLGGNSIHQDRRFIRNEWPKLDKMLHYRMLDVSAWKVVMNGKYKKVFAKPEEHRALDDIRGSIMELEFYLKRMKK
jgi:oligoribonuclease